MATRRMPQTWEHTCDACGATSITQNTSSIPEDWMKVLSTFSLVGNPMHDPDEFLTLCQNCTTIVVDACRDALSRELDGD